MGPMSGKGTMTELSAARRERSLPPASVERPIDLVHLARMTLGERSLEREVLQLFDRQAMILLARMQEAPIEAVPALAHTLKGSARAIGAAHVARAAEAVELMDAADPADCTRALGVLCAATDEARAYIADLLRAH
jgi:HPt (histidine-containing phosphotransfer) domain-containing protein